MRKFLFGMVAGASVWASTPAPTSPTFECADDLGVKYRIFLSRARLGVDYTELGVAKQAMLSSPNIAYRSVGKPGGPLVYVGWDPRASGRQSPLDFSSELFVHYRMAEGAAHATLGLVLDHRERTGLRCRSLHNALATDALDAQTPQAARLATMLDEVASYRKKDGTLNEIGLKATEAAIRRFVLSAAYANPIARAEFVKKAAPAIKKTAPFSVQELSNRFNGEALAFWKSTLEQLQYAYHPEMQRYIAWVQEGARPEPDRDLDCLRTAFSAFVRLPVYRQKDMRDIFAAEVTPSLKSLAERDVLVLSHEMDPESTSFLKQLWGKSVGRRTIADFPVIQEAVREIAAVVSQSDDDFDPRTAVSVILAFLKSSKASDPEARSVFVESATPHVKRLSNRKKEDLAPWLNKTDRRLMTELMR